LDTYLKTQYGELHTTVWDFWVAQKKFKPHLAAPVLAFLSIPKGSSDAERSLRSTKETSNNKNRGAKMTADHKKKVNFIYANAKLKLTDLAQKSHSD
jgi:hypothetical protein